MKTRIPPGWTRAWAASACLGIAAAGPYSPPADAPGSEAIALDSIQIAGWAVGWTQYTVGAECDLQWQTPERALGPAAGDPFDIVCLGRGGTLTLTVDPPVVDGPGPDFIVFENAVDDTFLELAYVEVSGDGEQFVRFPSDSLTPAPVPSFGAVDSTDIHGLAGTFRQGFGTPFDLADLPADTPSRITCIRLVDVIGDGSTLDSGGDVIYDPFPTVGSAGFDLDAIGVIHAAVDLELLVHETSVQVSFTAQTNRIYQVESAPVSAGEPAWSETDGVITGASNHASLTLPIDSHAHTLYRVRVTTPPAP